MSEDGSYSKVWDKKNFTVCKTKRQQKSLLPVLIFSRSGNFVRSQKVVYGQNQIWSKVRGGGIAQRLAHWLPVPAAPGSILGVPNNFQLDLIDVAVI